MQRPGPTDRPMRAPPNRSYRPSSPVPGAVSTSSTPSGSSSTRAWRPSARRVAEPTRRKPPSPPPSTGPRPARSHPMCPPVKTSSPAATRQWSNATGPTRHSSNGGVWTSVAAGSHASPKTSPNFAANDDKLVPSARLRPYRNASSGGQVLQTLAWILAIFEVAYEQDGHHPGFLLIDTPQKNLGGRAAADDEEFADVHLVEHFYTHILDWLAGPGRGAQIIVVDNTPPAVADRHVVVRFTRDPNRGKYGLIDNETS